MCENPGQRLKMGKTSFTFIACLLSFVSWSVCDNRICDIHFNKQRFDCHPDANPTQSNCNARGCCWRPAKAPAASAINDREGSPNVPYCFFPTDYMGYNGTSWKETDYGYSALLVRETASSWPNDVKTLALDIWFETDKRLHFKIHDPSTKRYEVPIETPPLPKRRAANPEYEVKHRDVPFGLTVSRKSNGAVLFDSVLHTSPLIFADQFIQMSSRLSTEYVYGLGGRKAKLLHNASVWQEFAMWSKDQAPQFDSNLYGVHPFYLNMEEDGQSHGVFLLNSNAMAVEIQPLPAITFRAIGGILDFYVFTGPTTRNVIEQYTQVVGRPQMPPYWSLGFHLCRYNYGSSLNLKAVIARNRKLKIPYEVQWNDIDYMDRHLDWTYDTKAYADLPDVVKDLHSYGQKYIVIVDPGISNEHPGNYKPYDSGMTAGVFVLNATGSPLVGKVWPGTTVFPDFTNPKTIDWWYNQAKSFHDSVPFDGLWTDMNEPSNFVEGSMSGCTSNNLDNPPYVPGITGDGKLAFQTVCPSAKQYLSSHYNLHNMYGLTEVVATNSALRKILNKRSLVISRSSFPSLGHFGGHWTGDISSTWEDLYYSIPAILEYQFYGIPMVGADICGFQMDTTEELCIRWMQLGAFYPFMRNHNDRDRKDQDPAAFSLKAQQIMKATLQIRYLLLPFFYTRFYYSHLFGSPVLQPLFSQYPNEKDTYAIDRQFMWGSELLVSPVLESGSTEVSAYFPSDLWYDFYTGERVDGTGKWVTLKAPLEKINIHVRGGSIIPVQQPAVTTTISRQNPFGLFVAFNSSGLASGSLFWDDGETLDSVKTKKFSFITFNAEQGSIVSTVVQSKYRPASGMYLTTANVLGVAKAPSSATVNGIAASIHYHPDTQEMRIDSFKADLLQSISIKWL